MVVLKTPREMELMRISGKIAARALKLAGEMVAPGTATDAIDKEVAKFIKSEGAFSSTLGYRGYPASTCISINNVVIHGIPSKSTILQNSDIVSIDISCHKNGFHGDNTRTFACGIISKEAKNLIEATRESFFEGLKMAKVGNRIGDVSSAIQEYVEKCGYSVVRKFVGHGVGTQLHEDPEVPNFGKPGRGPRLLEGMTLAIEPMVAQGIENVKILDDDWTVVTADGKIAAHYENTVAITSGEAEILTKAE